MNYPVWDVVTGGGVLIAIVSILHVFVSHFAVGGGLWLVITEMRANRQGDREMYDFVKGHSRFFMLLTLVFGAISGVGIWATIGLVSPSGTSALIHGYVWGWAMEWVFFFVEISAAIIYYYGWTRLSKKTHELFGWIYFITAFMSLVIINGIITFMLTPGGWLETHDFWTGFFNPTFWPSAVIRTCAGVAIAGFFTLMSAAGLPKGDFRTRITRWNAGWAVIAMIGVILSAIWYGRSVGVWEENEALLGAITVLPGMISLFKTGLIITLALSLIPLVLPKLWNRTLVLPLLLAGLMTMGAGEWVREAGRKPFTIHGYLYSTGMLVSEQETFEAEGMLAGTKWISPEAADDPLRLGGDLYRAWCLPCHTVDGYNGLEPFLAHWNRETVDSLIPRLEYMRALMPPWYGTEEENAALGDYLMTLKPATEATLPEDSRAAARLSFDLSCGLCHTPNGYRALVGNFEDMDRDEISEFLDEAGDLTDEMPGYFGGEAQRERLIDFLQALDTPAEEGNES